MAEGTPDLRYGRIIWARVTDTRGYRKDRPCIVLTPTAEITHNAPMVVMAITTTFPDPTPPDCVVLPWNNDPRKTRTQLSRRSAAVTTWLETIYPDEVLPVRGDVPAHVMQAIQTKLRR